VARLPGAARRSGIGGIARCAAGHDVHARLQVVITTWDGKLWKVPVAGGSPVEIPFQVDVVQALGPAVRFEYPIPDSATFTIKQIRDATPSPDGRRLAFVALDRLYVMDYPNGTPKRLTNSTLGEFEPSWSPMGNGSSTRRGAGDGGHVYKMHADGSGQPQRLTTASAYWQHPKFLAERRAHRRGARTGARVQSRARAGHAGRRGRRGVGSRPMAAMRSSSRPPAA